MSTDTSEKMKIRKTYSARAQLKYRLAWAWVVQHSPEVAQQLDDIANKKYPAVRRSSYAAGRESVELLKGVV
jgi:hypothetical protein